MSQLNVNKIAKYSGNNVSIDDKLKLKNYTTTERDALTSVAGDMLFNTTTGKAEVYNGSSFQELGGVDVVQVEYLAIGGGGGGGSGWNNVAYRPGGGGGAGGVITNITGEQSGGGNTADPSLYLVPSTNYLVTIGAGGNKGNGAYATQPSAERGGNAGASTRFGKAFAFGGGGGGGRNSAGGSTDGFSSGTKGGSGGGQTTGGGENTMDGGTQGHRGGNGNQSNYAQGGGGGAGADGNGTNGVAPGGNGYGGIGITNSILTTTEATANSVGVVSGSDVYYAGGGASGGNSGDASIPDGGLGGGGRGSSTNGDNGQDGTVNTGGGGGGGASRSDGYGWDGSNGGSGLLVLRYTNERTITIGAGLTSTTITQGSNKVTIFTAGTGQVSFA